MLPDCDGVAHALVIVTIMVVMKEIKICVMKELQLFDRNHHTELLQDLKERVSFSRARHSLQSDCLTFPKPHLCM